MNNHLHTVAKVRLILGLIACGAIAAWAWFGMAGAKADSNDTLFLNVLSSEGIISHAGTADLISAGHSVCTARAGGMAELAVASVVQQSSRLSAYDSGFFVGAAEAAYCPQYSGSSRAA